jgi:hypothetical protein
LFSSYKYFLFLKKNNFWKKNIWFIFLELT